MFYLLGAGRTVLVVSQVDDQGDLLTPVVEVYDFLSRTWRIFEPPLSSEKDTNLPKSNTDKRQEVLREGSRIDTLYCENQNNQKQLTLKKAYFDQTKYTWKWKVYFSHFYIYKLFSVDATENAESLFFLFFVHEKIRKSPYKIE